MINKSETGSKLITLVDRPRKTQFKTWSEKDLMLNGTAKSTPLEVSGLSVNGKIWNFPIRTVRDS